MSEASLVNTSAVNVVRKHFTRGDMVFIGHNHLGKSKIKIKYGPMKMRTKRLEVDNATLDKIKEFLRTPRG